MPFRQPDPFSVPIAEYGDKTLPPETEAGRGRMSLNQGFPPETQVRPEAGGVPPHRHDFNGALNLLSSHAVFHQYGGLHTFNPVIAEDGGYPMGAVLAFSNPAIPLRVRSLKDNNRDNFNVSPEFVGVSWAVEGPGIMPWNAGFYFEPPCMVFGPDGLLYLCVQPSGPGTGSGPKEPGKTPGYWLALADSFGGRKYISDPVVLYARADGNDNNDGLTPGAALRNPLEAAYYINNKLDLASTYVSLDIGQGTFDWDSNVAIAPICSGEGGNMQADQARFSVRILGAGQDLTVLRDGIQVGRTTAYIKGLKTIPGTGRVTCAFEALNGANLTCENVSCELNDTGNNNVRGFGSTQAQMSILGATKISGTRCYCAIHGSYHSTVALQGSFAILNPAMVVSGEVLRSLSNTYFLVRSTYSGTCVGKKYGVTASSGLDTAGTYNNVPGTLTGAVDATSWIK